MKNSRLEARRKNIPLEEKILFEKNFAIVEQIFLILSKQGKDQKHLADRLKKNESEISKWMRGNHNFTLRTIAKIESVLGEDILICPKDSKFAVNNYFLQVSPDNVIKLQPSPTLKKKAMELAGQNLSLDISADEEARQQVGQSQMN